MFDSPDRECISRILCANLSMLTERRRSWHNVVRKALVRPFALSIQEPIIQVFAAFLSFVYGTFYSEFHFCLACPLCQCIYSRISLRVVFLTTIPSIFEGVYQEPVGTAGLHYIALGIGSTVMAQLCGQFLDMSYKHLCARNGGVGKPEFRLRAFPRS